nr:reverse transcriptase domain-containing protein [Tanacetum cinerariifolium]
MRVKMLELLRKMISVINGKNNKDSEKVSCGNLRGFNIFGGDRVPSIKKEANIGTHLNLLDWLKDDVLPPPSEDDMTRQKNFRHRFDISQIKMRDGVTEFKNVLHCVKIAFGESMYKQTVPHVSGCNKNQVSTTGTLRSNTIPNPKGEMKAITTQNGVSYKGPSISTPKKVVKRETKKTTDKEQTNFHGSTSHIQPSVTLILKPDVPKTLPKPNIPYTSRLNGQKLREKATNQMERFFQIFQDLHFDISFADALLLMSKFASTIKSLLTNKDKLFELAKISLNENCSAMLLKKLPKKLRDPGKFLIPCDFSGMDVCHALADLSASINLMPLSIWKKLSLLELTPTRMTLELADRSITRPKGLAEDVFVKVRNFHFLTDFVVVDFEADPRVPLILGRSFLRTGCALIDVYGEEITLQVNDEAVTFNLNQTTRHSSTYDDLSVNQIDIIDVARKERMVDRVKVDVIAKLPHRTTVKGVRSFLGHVGFYRRFIQDFSKIARPMTHLLEKETPFVFSKDCINAFETLKKKLTKAPILVVPDRNLPFELMCDASDFAIGAVLGQ